MSFQIDRFGEPKDKLPADVLREVPADPDEKKSVLQQLKDNLRITFKCAGWKFWKPKQVGIKTGAKF